MFIVTDSAAQYLSEKLAEIEAPSEVGARFILGDQELSVEIDEPRPDDATFRHGGRTVALLNRDTAAHLAGMTLDLMDTAEGPKLALISQARQAERNGHLPH